MYKILIADDEATSREKTQAALITTFENATISEKRYEKAKDVYDIQSFSVAGKAIQEIKNGYKPDLALLDISFAKLKAIVLNKEPSLNFETETSTLRGFDVYDALTQFSPTTKIMLFTGYAAEFAEITAELVKRGMYQGEHYYLTIVGKDWDLNTFANSIKKNLMSVTDQILNNNGVSDIEDLKIILPTRNANAIAAANITLGDRAFTVRNFLIHQFSLPQNTNEIIPHENFVDYVSEYFENYLNPPIQEEEIIIPNLANENVRFCGVWQAQWVQDAITAFRQNPNYTQINNSINAFAANIILEYLQVSHQFQQKAHITQYRYITGNSNIGNRERFYIEADWIVSFHNALTMRRVYLGLCALANEHIWSPNRARVLNELFGLIFQAIEGVAYTDNNTRNRMNIIMGLGITANGVNVQRLNMAANRQLQEEKDFLIEQIPEILVRMRNRNNNQPDPIYTEFE